MNKYYFTFLVWLLPVYFIFQCGYQVSTYFAMQDTYNEGDSYIASVTDIDIKQIAAQTNGYVVLKFTTNTGDVVERQLSVSVQIVQEILDSELIPVRYKADSANPIVIMSTFELQQSIIKINIAVLFIGLVVTILISIWASRFARKKIRYGEEILNIERVDEIE